MYGSEEIIDVKELIRKFAKRKRFLLFGAIIGSLLGVLYLHFATYTYTVAMKITPVNSQQGVSSGRLGSLASLAGVNLPVGSDSETKFKLYLAGLTSRTTAEALLAEHDLLRQMFPGEWSDDHNAWREPRSLRTALKKGVANFLGVHAGEYKGPTVSRVEKYLRSVIRIEEGDDNPISRISINVVNPKYGEELLFFLDHTSNSFLQERDRQRAQKYIEYLKDNLDKTSLIEQRNAYASMLLEQEKMLMLASSSLPYAAEILEQPSSSERPTLPNPILILVLTTSAGLFLSIILVLWFDSGKEAASTSITDDS